VSVSDSDDFVLERSAQQVRLFTSLVYPSVLNGYFFNILSLFETLSLGKSIRDHPGCQLPTLLQHLKIMAILSIVGLSYESEYFILS